MSGAYNEGLGYGWGIPDPQGSPHEKVETPRKTWPINRFHEVERLLREEGLDESLIGPISRAMRRLGEDIHLDVKANLEKYEWHANVHTHPAAGIGGGFISQEWVFETQGQITLMVVNPGGDELYAYRNPASGERIYGVLTSDGSQKWDVSGPNSGWDLVASPDGNHIYHTDNQDVVKLDISDGSEVWRSNGGSSDAKYGLSVSPDNSTVYAVTTDSLRVLNASDGSLIRAESTEFTGTRKLEISPDGSKLFMAEAFSSEVKAVDPSNGSTLWTYTGHSGSEENHGLDVSHDGSFVCSCNNNGEVHAIDTEEGSGLWAYPGFSNSVRRVEISPDDAVVYAVSPEEGETHAIDASDGSSVGSPYTDVGYPLTIEVATDGSAVFIGGSPEGLDSSSGVIHKVATG